MHHTGRRFGCRQRRYKLEKHQPNGRGYGGCGYARRFKTVSETSKSLLRSECALPVVQQDYDKADTLVECLKQPALAGLKEAARAMEQKQGSIDEGGRNVTNLINDTMDGLGIQELKFCTQEERLRYEKGESEKFPECDMEIKGGGGGRFGSFM